MFQILTVLSLLPEAKVVPSWAKQTELTHSVLPFETDSNANAPDFQKSDNAPGFQNSGAKSFCISLLIQYTL